MEATMSESTSQNTIVAAVVRGKTVRLRQPDLPVFPQGRSPVPAPTSDRGRAFVRLFVILQQLQSSRVGVTLEQLAAETGVVTRTIRRDLEVLQEVGIPLVDEFDENGDVRPVRRWRVMGRSLSDLRPAVQR
jgi:HTH domain